MMGFEPVPRGHIYVALPDTLTIQPPDIGNTMRWQGTLPGTGWVMQLDDRASYQILVVRQYN